MTMKWHRGKTIWFTGLSGSGKSTLASMLKNILESRGIPVVLLDGDILRDGLNRDLTFSAADRAENIRRAAEVAKILSDAGHIVLSAFITPMESLRIAVRNIFDPARYIEVFLDTPLSICERRDPKGLYRRARAGEIPAFTGISAPFERPANPDLVVPTGVQKVEESLSMLLSYLERRFSDLASFSAGSQSLAAVGYRKRVAVIGLDGVPPSLIFGEASGELPNLKALMDHGAWGPLRSTDPPITVPAWTTMTTGKDPGELGLYGFRNRPDHGYGPMETAHSHKVEARRVWNYLEDAGKASVLIGIPQTYPPVAHNGITVAGILTPGIGSEFTFPPELAGNLPDIARGEYMTDVSDFRTANKDRLLRDLYAMADRRFNVAEHFLINENWDFFMMVEIGTDRLHHAFWKCSDSDHPLHDPQSKYKTAIRDFYKYIDARIGSLLGRLMDETTVMVVSDHGCRNLLGGVCVNEWLIKKGFLTLRNQVHEETAFTHDLVDWSATKAWSEGGYYARVFLNVKGREPSGIVDPGEYHSFRDHLAKLLADITDEQGCGMATRTLKPEEIFRSCKGVPPDLIVYFDDLNRRSIGTVGTGEVLKPVHDAGPDGANHDPDGIFIVTKMTDLRNGTKKGREIIGASLMDITPTILHEFGLAVPHHMGGRIINSEDPDAMRIAMGAARDADQAPEEEPESKLGYTSEEEEIIRKRLADLGYI